MMTSHVATATSRPQRRYVGMNRRRTQYALAFWVLSGGLLGGLATEAGAAKPSCSLSVIDHNDSTITVRYSPPDRWARTVWVAGQPTTLQPGQTATLPRTPTFDYPTVGNTISVDETIAMCSTPPSSTTSSSTTAAPTTTASTVPATTSSTISSSTSTSVPATTTSVVSPTTVTAPTTTSTTPDVTTTTGGQTTDSTPDEPPTVTTFDTTPLPPASVPATTASTSVVLAPPTRLPRTGVNTATAVAVGLSLSVTGAILAHTYRRDRSGN